MPTKQEYIVDLADQRFKSSYRELLAHLPNVNESLVAYIQLNDADELSSTELDFNAYLKILENALVRLIDSETLSPIVPYNSLALAELAQLRRATGVGVEALPPLPPKPLSRQEELEQRVSKDWDTLKVADFKKNCANDKSYRECFERLSAEDRLGSNAATALIRAGA